MKISECYKLVPLEQTDEMRTGGGQILDYEYDVLLSAAPSAPTKAIERVVRDAVQFLAEFDKAQGDIIAAKVRLAKSLAVLKQVMEKQP